MEFPQRPLIQDTESKMRAPGRRIEENKTQEYGGWWSLGQHSLLISDAEKFRTGGLSLLALA